MISSSSRAITTSTGDDIPAHLGRGAIHPFGGATRRQLEATAIAPEFKDSLARLACGTVWHFLRIERRVGF